MKSDTQYALFMPTAHVFGLRWFPAFETAFRIIK
jgi:hypothetical protein